MVTDEPPLALRADSLPATVEGQRLCIACGMCCNGDIHMRSLLEPAEVPDARELGLPIVDVDGRPAFRQPCPRHIENRCTVYTDPRKPHVCSSYQCRLLERFLQGEIGLDESLEFVRQARSLIAGLRSEIGLDKSTSIWTQLTRWSADDSPKKPSTRMRIGLLMRLLVKVFLPPGTAVGPTQPPPDLEAPKDKRSPRETPVDEVKPRVLDRSVRAPRPKRDA